MMRSTVGVIFSNIHDENIPELSKHRTMASIPFVGRYRLVDFSLSNMVNSGISTVGIVTKNNYQSLMDHLGSGKDWDLARKDGGIILLPPYSNETDKPYSSRLEALMSITSFLNRRREDYVLLSDCDGVCRMDLRDVLRFHIENHADITMVYHREHTIDSNYYLTLDPDETGRVRGVKINPDVKGKDSFFLYINIMIMRREFLVNLIESAFERGFTSFGRDILTKNVDSMRIFGYPFEGYYAGINSLGNYFCHSMEFLNRSVREEIFGAHDVYTKVQDSAPTRYLSGAVAKNSLISDGCTIEGTVENSILFRGVKIGKGSYVRNSILMQDSVVGSGVWLECVLSDKGVVVRDGRHLSGCEELPYFIGKGRMI